MSKKLAVKGENTALAPVPEYLKNGTGRGMEKAEQKDIMLPRVKLLQALSPEVAEGGKQAGLIVESISGNPFVGDGKTLEFIPVTMFKNRTMFDGIGKEAVVSCTSLDNIKSSTGDICAECESSKWAEDKKGKRVPPACTEFYNFPIVILGGKKPIISVLNLASTKIKVARKLLTLVRHTGLDMFALKFKLSVVKETANSQTYYNFDVEGAGYPTESEYKFAEQFYEATKTKNVVVETESDTVAQTPAAGKNGKKHKAI